MKKSLVFHGSTSIGKTHIIKTFIINEVLENEKKNFVIVVPTKALIAEVYSDLVDKLKYELTAKHYKVITNSHQIDINDDANYIMIFTQERFLNYLLDNNTLQLHYVFIDEAHKLLKKDFRSIHFYKILDLLMEMANIPNIVFSSPIIENPEEVLKLIPNGLKRAVNTFEFSPVNQEKFILDYSNKNIRVYNDLTKTFIELEYDEINQYDMNKILNLIGKKKRNIVFCNSKQKAVELAIEYANNMVINKEIENNEYIIKFKKQIENEIHKEYNLLELLSKGIAYHIGYIPANIRKNLEILYKEGLIKTIFCTSTLLEGVNLPADNLFLTIEDKTNVMKDEIDFKNLIGRVGRIKYNLIGNVIIIPKSEEKENEIISNCMNLINSKVKNKELSIKDLLTNEKKKEILENIINNKPTIDKKTGTRDRFSFDCYNSYKVIISDVIDSVVNDKTSNTYSEFSEIIDEKSIQKIKTQYNNSKEYISKDMPITIDIINNLVKNIKEKELKYPIIFDYTNILMFLYELYEIFNWESEESKKDIGNKNKLKYYALLLQWWMSEIPLNLIIKYTLEKCENDGVMYDGITGAREEYKGTKKQINEIINQVLDNIENIILFKISNYFSKFSEIYKKVEGKDNIKNDWYEFIQYGTNKKEMILLQQLGFSREIALKIYNKGYCFINEKGNINIYDTILDDSNNDIVAETVNVKYNYANIFIEKIKKEE